jgi:hypothetical protein
MDWTEFEVDNTVAICEKCAPNSMRGDKLLLVSKLAKTKTNRETAIQVLRIVASNSVMHSVKIDLIRLLDLLDRRLTPEAELLMIVDDVVFIGGGKCSASISCQDCTMLITGPVDVVYRAVKAALADK